MPEFELVPLREIVDRVERLVEVDPLEEYPMAGVRSFGGGCFDSGRLSGADTKYRKFIRLRHGDLVYPKLMAWEGAFAVVPSEFDGYYSSTEFCTFKVRAGRADTRYLAHLFRWKETWGRVAATSIGTNVRRRRLYPEAFLDRSVPLPDLSEQERLAARLDQLTDKISEVNRLTRESRRLADASMSALVPQDAPATEVGKHVALVKRIEQVFPNKTYILLGTRWYAGGLFAKDQKTGGDISAARLFRVHAGDFVYNRLFAWKGSFALASQEDDGCYVSGEFPTFEIDRKSVHPEYLMAVFRRPSAWQAAFDRSTGSTPTSRNRLKVERFLQMEIPVPSMPVQREVVELARKTQAALQLRKEQGELLSALGPSVLNHAFNGNL